MAAKEALVVTGFAHEYKRHGTTTLFAALNVASGLVHAGHYRRRRRREFLDSRPSPGLRATCLRRDVAAATRLRSGVISPDARAPLHPFGQIGMAAVLQGLGTPGKHSEVKGSPSRNHGCEEPQGVPRFTLASAAKTEAINIASYRTNEAANLM